MNVRAPCNWYASEMDPDDVEQETDDEPQESADDSHDGGDNVFISHAWKMWNAEVVNADRYTRHVRLLITLSMTFAGVIVFRLSQIVLEPAGGRWLDVEWSSVLSALGTVAATHLLIRPTILAKVIGIVLVAVGIVCALALTSHVVHVAAGAAFGLAIYALVAVFVAMRTLLSPPRSPSPRFGLQDRHVKYPASPRDFDAASVQESGDHTATYWLALSDSALKRARRRLADEEWTVFWRVYVGALDLRERNQLLRTGIRQAQTLIRTGLLLTPLALIVTLAASLFYE